MSAGMRVQRCITYLACASSAAEGARLAGEDMELVSLNDLNTGMCQACDNGWGTCQASMEGWIEHVRARRFAMIPVNRWSWAYKVVTLRSAAEAMVKKNEPPH